MFIPLDRENPSIQRCMGVLLIMGGQSSSRSSSATLWISEAIPLSVTSLLPVVLFPVLNVLSATAVSQQYFNNGRLVSSLSRPVIFMFFAGFLMSLAMEKWNLHMRIALSIMKFFTRPRAMLLGVMATAAFLSIFVSNTAAALMMVANCKALVESLRLCYGDKKVLGFSKAIFLGIASSRVLSSILDSPPASAAFPLSSPRRPT